MVDMENNHMTNKEAIAAHAAAQAEVKRLWNLMCVADGIDPHSKFVVFADANPHAIAYNEAMAAFQLIRKRINRNTLRRERHAVMTSLGMKRVKGSLGGVYYE